MIRKVLMVVAGLAIGLGSWQIARSQEDAVALPQRFLDATVKIDGETILEWGGHDDGVADADDLWEQLKTIQFQPTDAFESVALTQTEGGIRIASLGEPNTPNQTIELEIRYGGIVRVDQLDLVPAIDDEGNKMWQLEPSQVNALFNQRLITRHSAGLLADPSKSWTMK